MTTGITTLIWIIGSSLLMCLLALVGVITLSMSEKAMKLLLLPLVALAAGALLGGAFFHMIPESVDKTGSDTAVYIYVVAGFAFFLLLEQVLHWHHCHREDLHCKKPLTYLILIGDGIHNFIGGIAVAGTFLIDIRLGISTWLAAAAHEIPQELGDFGVLVHGGWSRKKALLLNLLSASTFLLGGILAFMFSFSDWIYFLIPFAAGNFIYIGASDLIPEVNRHEKFSRNILHFCCFSTGILILLVLRIMFSA
ncbi:MAG: zinc transporter [Desulfobacterales bacterium SG8_35_2]|jgi:zinc and cadmium transporter|nr:MAG: zinc transporter [Desulfobacterales bacterium SG8_35_2]